MAICLIASCCVASCCTPWRPSQIIASQAIACHCKYCKLLLLQAIASYCKLLCAIAAIAAQAIAATASYHIASYCKLLQTIGRLFQAIAAIAKDAHIPLIVDNTLATPYLLQPIKWGADLVVNSTTKFLSGHGKTDSYEAAATGIRL